MVKNLHKWFFLGTRKEDLLVDWEQVSLAKGLSYRGLPRGVLLFSQLEDNVTVSLTARQNRRDKTTNPISIPVKRWKLKIFRCGDRMYQTRSLFVVKVLELNVLCITTLNLSNKSWKSTVSWATLLVFRQ